MAELSGKATERINTLMFIGAGLWSLWYLSQSVRLTSEEKAIIQDLLNRQRFDKYIQLAAKFN